MKTFLFSVDALAMYEQVEALNQIRAEWKFKEELRLAYCHTPKLRKQIDALGGLSNLQIEVCEV
jgi:hypothetical protein